MSHYDIHVCDVIKYSEMVMARTARSKIALTNKEKKYNVSLIFIKLNREIFTCYNFISLFKMFFEGKLYGKAISQSQAANSFVPRLFSSPVCLILLAYERTCFFGSLKLSKNSKVHTQERIYF